jgi:hypothetical protein
MNVSRNFKPLFANVIPTVFSSVQLRYFLVPLVPCLHYLVLLVAVRSEVAVGSAVMDGTDFFELLAFLLDLVEESLGDAV